MEPTLPFDIASALTLWLYCIVGALGIYFLVEYLQPKMNQKENIQMPVKRITLKPQVQRKLVSLSRRPKHERLAKAINTLSKVTTTPSKDTIVWEPTEEFCREAARSLQEELTYIERKRGTVMFGFIEDTIAELKTYLSEESLESLKEAPPPPPTTPKMSDDEPNVQAGSLDDKVPNSTDASQRGFNPGEDDTRL